MFDHRLLVSIHACVSGQLCLLLVSLISWLSGNLACLENPSIYLVMLVQFASTFGPYPSFQLLLGLAIPSL